MKPKKWRPNKKKCLSKATTSLELDTGWCATSARNKHINIQYNNVLFLISIFLFHIMFKATVSSYKNNSIEINRNDNRKHWPKHGEDKAKRKKIKMSTRVHSFTAGVHYKNFLIIFFSHFAMCFCFCSLSNK